MHHDYSPQLRSETRTKTKVRLKRKEMIMETYTIEDIKNEVYGEIGTLRRDKIETELSNLRVGLQIRNAREARKMTQNELAGKIGKERSFISKVERDGSNLTLSTLYDIVTKGLGGKLDIQVQL